MKVSGLALLFSFICSYAMSQEYVYVFLNTNPNKEALSEHKVDSLQEGHLNNIRKLAKEDKLLVAGPFDSGGGIFIMNTTSTQEALDWISADPAIAANRYRLETFRWKMRVGGVCPIGPEASFDTYTFVRYTPHITKFNVQQAPHLFRQHDVYIKDIVKTGNVISEGVFSNGDGGVLILRGDVEEEVIMRDPTVIDGIIEPEIKKIWVGKGSFCEK